MAEFRVSEKLSKNGSIFGLGEKVEKDSLEAFPTSKAMMMTMVDHNNHHRPLSSCYDGDGPTNSVSVASNINKRITHVHSGASASASAVRNLQPFDISNSNSAVTTSHPTFIAPAEVGMAASLGSPFTIAQWKELERQAMIYKYMLASVPVPPDLLIPTSLQAASRSSLEGGLNLRLSSRSNDPEPGRCRRTDGKKWRCSRDVAPNHKYCERHMHRGRPRSRKHVEVVHANTNDNENLQIKRARCEDNHPFSVSSATACLAFSDPTTRRDESSSQFHASNITQPYNESSFFSLDKFGSASFEPLASVTSIKEPRGLDWMLKGQSISIAASNPEWQPLMADKVVLNTQNSCNNKNAYISSPNHEEPLYLNSYGIFNHLVTMEPPQSEKPRSFIDAWSNAETMENNANTSNKSNASSNGNLSFSSLALSMGGGSVDEDIGTIQMGLGIMEPEQNTEAGNKIHLTNWLSPAPWVASSSTTPGGPLAEVLRPSVVATTTVGGGSNPSSPQVTNAESGSPLAMGVSSPSGVLQKTLVSFSDSSSSSSPTIASSRTNSETPMIWFNSARPN